MRLIAGRPSSAHVAVALEPEEWMILLQPDEMLRSVLDSDPAFRAAAGFLLPAPGTPGEILAVLPRPAAAALLAAPAAHAAERDLQHLLFTILEPAERPAL